MFAALALLLFLQPPESSVTHQSALALYKQKKYQEAIAAFENAAKTEAPGSVEFKETALLIGQSYFQLAQAPKAIPWLEKVTALNEANYMLGYAYLQIGRQDESRRAFARLFSVPPESAAGHLMAGQMMLKKEYESQAAREIESAIATDPKLPNAHFLSAEIAIFRGRLDEGVERLNQELALNPAFSMAWYRRGDAFSRQGNWDRAIPDLQRAVWLNPDFSGPFILLGKCYFKKAEYVNAEGILRRALQLDPRNYSATYLLGQTLMLEGKEQEGHAVLDQLRTLKEQAPPF